MLASDPSYVKVIAAIIVDNIEAATAYYNGLFTAKPLYQINHIQNYVDLKEILKNAPLNIQEIDASVRFINLGTNHFVFELAEFHNIPYQLNNSNSIIIKYYVDNLAIIFENIKSRDDIQLLSNNEKLSTVYTPCKKFQENTIFFVDEKIKTDILNEASNQLGGFIFIDKYNVQWEVLGDLNEIPESV